MKSKNVTPKSETEKGEAPTTKIKTAEEMVDKLKLFGVVDLMKKNICKAMHEYHEQFGDGWISVDERLPDHCYDVLVCYKDNDPEIGRLYHSRKKGTYTFVTPNELSGLDVTHWQPLPQKPQTQKS